MNEDRNSSARRSQKRPWMRTVARRVWFNFWVFLDARVFVAFCVGVSTDRRSFEGGVLTCAIVVAVEVGRCGFVES